MTADRVILAAEDDPDDILMLKLAFQHAAAFCDLKFVANGEQLMDYILQRFDNEGNELFPMPLIVILDLNMPKKDGRLALKEIRERQDLQSLRVIVLTTSAAREDVDYCKTMGVSEYFVKPSTFKEWVDIAEYISKSCSDIYGSRG